MRTVLMGAAFANHASAFALLMRYQNQARRDYFRALKHLELLRTGKAGYLPAQPPVQLAENRTNPTTTATAVAKCQTNPHPAAATPKTDHPPAPYIPSPEELRRLLGPLEDESR